MKKFKSKLAPYIIATINEKRQNGYIYEAEELVFKRFDNFIIENNLDTGLITRDVVMEYSIQKPTESNNSRMDRLVRISAISRYMNSIGLEAYIPHNLGTRTKPIPYLPTKKEISTFFISLDSQTQLNCHYRFNLLYAIIFRVIYCCGLRISEAINLTKTNINLTKGELIISCSKGDKTRLVYLAEDLRLLCIKYDKTIAKIIPNRKYFFPGRKINRPINKSSINNIFRRTWNKSQPNFKGKMPTVQNLRHCFITYKINEWQSNGINVDVMTPYLSKYVGHATIQETYYYYHALDGHSQAVRQIVTDSDKNILEVIPYDPKF